MRGVESQDTVLEVVGKVGIASEYWKMKKAGWPVGIIYFFLLPVGTSMRCHHPFRCGMLYRQLDSSCFTHRDISSVTSPMQEYDYILACDLRVSF